MEIPEAETPRKPTCGECALAEPPPQIVRRCMGASRLFFCPTRQTYVKIIVHAAECGDCGLFYGNGWCHKDPNNPVIQRTGGVICDKFIPRDNITT